MKAKKAAKAICLLSKFTIFILLTVVSVLISKEVFEQYASKDTAFKKSQEPISEDESITLVVALWPLKNMNYPSNVPNQAKEQWELGKDFTLSFGVTEYRTAKERITLKEGDGNLKINHSQIGQVSFQKILGKWGYGYKISANLIHVKKPFDPFVNVEFSKDILDKDVPKVDLYLSSEPNSYGFSLFSYQDGQQLLLSNVKGFLLVETKQKKIVKLKSSLTCQKESYYECFHSKLILEDYSSCPRKCFAISTPMNATPICETTEEFQCAYEVAMKVANDNSSTKCLPACTEMDLSITNSYQEDLEKPNAGRNVTLRCVMSDDTMTVEKEYLINDFVKMLGSIGGTLGMCIGFSFLGMATMILQNLEIFTNKIIL